MAKTISFYLVDDVAKFVEDNEEDIKDLLERFTDNPNKFKELIEEF